MTVLEGARVDSPLAKTTSERLSLSLSQYEVDYWLTPRFGEHPTHTAEMRPFVREFVYAYPYNLPVSAGLGEKSGAYAYAYKHDFYYRVHIIPRVLDFGNLINTEVRDLVVWNAFFECAYMQTPTEPSQPGVIVGMPEGVTVPYVLKPTEEIVLRITATLSGPPSIDADFDIVIDGQTYEIEVTGRRILLWPFPPNWGTPLDDTYAFRSWALRASDGTVQAGSQWGNQPRREMSYNILLRRDDAARAENLLFAWQNRLYGVVCWPEKSVLTADVNVGSLFVPCDTANRSFSEGGFLTIYKSTTEHESAEIDSVEAGGVYVTSDIKQTWPAGTKVYPVFAGLVNESTVGSRHTDGVTEMSVSFESEPSSTYGNTAAETAAATYQGYELYLSPLNWASAIPFEFSSDRTKIDYNTGKFYTFSESGFSPLRKDHNWMFKNREQAQAFRSWLGRREGIARPVYMPTGTTDMTLISDPLDGSSYIDVISNEYDLLAAHPARRDLIFVMRDGTYHLRRITGAQAIAGGLRVNLDQLWADTIDRTTVKRISFLGLFRLVSNKATMRWLTEDKGTATLSLVTDRTD